MSAAPYQNIEMKTEPLVGLPYGIDAACPREMVTEAASADGRATFTMNISDAHIGSGTVLLDGCRVLAGGPIWPVWADKFEDGGVCRRWKELSREDGEIVLGLLSAVGDRNNQLRERWAESLTYEQSKIVDQANNQYEKLVHEVINEGGEGHGSPVLPDVDNTPWMKGDDQP